MPIAKDLVPITVECVRNPGRESIWSPGLGKYVCPDSVVQKGQTCLDAFRRGVWQPSLPLQQSSATPPR